jgi:hypothetical protein
VDVKKAELKRLLKPMIKDCIKECLYEEGILSSIVSEVVKGMGTNVIKEEAKPPAFASDPHNPTQQKTGGNQGLREHKQKLLDAIGKDAYGGVDIFEGTTPTRPQRSPEASSPLGDIEPSDPGVDISGIVALGGKNWKAFIG